MAVEKIKELLKKIKTDTKAQEALQGLIKPADQDGVIHYYAEAAKKLGFDVTEQDIRDAVTDAMKEIAGRTEAAAGQIEALTDEVLEKAAGGKKDHSECMDTFKDKENCWSNDGCDHYVHGYGNYECQHNDRGHSCGEKEQLQCSSVLF